MRVVHVIARLNIGGPAVHVGLACQWLRRMGHEATLVAGRVAPPEGDMGYACTERGVEPLYIDTLGRSLSPLSDLRSLGDLIDLFREMRPDVVHTHTSKAGALGRAAARIAGVRGVVHTFHGHVLSGYFGGATNLAIRLVERGLAALTDKIVVLGQQQKDELAAHGIALAEKIEVMRFGLDLEPFTKAKELGAPKRRELGLPEDVPVVGIVGRLTAIKGHEYFLEMARRLPEARFLIVGDGELRNPIQESIQRKGLEGRVVLTGWAKEVAPLYGAMDALALTSLNEGSPVVLKEAMAAGVPCVAHAVGGVPDLITHGETGWLSDVGDADALVANVRRALGPEGDAVVARARDWVLREHGVEQMMRTLERIYRGLGRGR